MKTLRQFLSRYVYSSTRPSLKYFTPNLFADSVEQEGKSFIVSIAVPGLNKEDLQVYVTGRVLVITSKKQTLSNACPTKSGGNAARFKHSFIIPRHVDTNRIHAKYRLGLLTINFEQEKSKSIHRVINVTSSDSEKNKPSLHSWWQRVAANWEVRKLIPG